MIPTADFLTLLGGFLISLCVFSLILGDNGLFRFSASILSGVLSAYVCILIIKKVFLPRFLEPLLDPGESWESKLILLAVLAGALFLFTKVFLANTSASTAAGGNLVLAALLCIMTAVTIAGIADGTIVGLYRGLLGNFQPAENSAGQTQRWIESGIILIGTVTSLFSMRHYQIKKKEQPAGGGFFSALGEIFIGIALGSIFAGTFIASAIILVNQLSKLMNTGLTLFQWIK